MKVCIDIREGPKYPLFSAISGYSPEVPPARGVEGAPGRLLQLPRREVSHEVVVVAVTLLRILSLNFRFKICMTST